MVTAVLLAVVFGFEAVASFFVKRWSAGGPIEHLAAGIILYGASVVTWAYALKRIELYRAVLYYAVGSAVLYMVIGHFGYDEHINRNQGIGAALGLASLVLLSM